MDGAFTVPGDGCIDYKPFLKVLKDNKPYLLFGIPYYTKEGKNEFIFKSENIIKKVTLNILRKKYPIQKIEIKKFWDSCFLY